MAKRVMHNGDEVLYRVSTDLAFRIKFDGERVRVNSEYCRSTVKAERNPTFGHYDLTVVSTTDESEDSINYANNN